MARVLDITDKLSFDENPKLLIKGEEIEVNSDAPTVLKVMSMMGKEDPGMEEIVDAIDLLFTKESRKKIEKMKLSIGDLIVVVQEAIKLITGEATTAGEIPTHAMTF